MRSNGTIDAVEARLLMALSAQPRATTSALAEFLGLSRNTVQSRLTKLEQRGTLGSFERRINTEALGYPLLAFVTTTVTQRKLDDVAEALGRVPEVVEVHGLSGETDLLVRVVAQDADDLYRIAGRILASDGVERTNTALVMRDMVAHRLTPLLERIAER